MNQSKTTEKLKVIVYNQKLYIRILEKKLAHFQKEFEDYKSESVKWSWEDFVYRAKDTGYRISKKQSIEALYNMIRKHDASLGINWDTIDYYIEQYGVKLKIKKHE